MFSVPVIEEHPKSCLIELGKDIVLHCKAIGKNLRYRWYKSTKCLYQEVSRLHNVSYYILWHPGVDKKNFNLFNSQFLNFFG